MTSSVSVGRYSCSGHALRPSVKQCLENSNQTLQNKPACRHPQLDLDQHFIDWKIKSMNIKHWSMWINIVIHTLSLKIFWGLFLSHSISFQQLAAHNEVHQWPVWAVLAGRDQYWQEEEDPRLTSALLHILHTTHRTLVSKSTSKWLETDMYLPKHSCEDKYTLDPSKGLVLDIYLMSSN